MPVAHRDERRRHEHQRDREDLGHEVRPVGRRRGVDDLVHAAITVAPDQLAAVIDRDDERHDRERAGQRLDDQSRDRIRVAAVPVADGPRRQARVDDADEEQHEEGRAAEHEGHVEARERPELREAAGSLRRGRVRGECDRRGRRLVELDARGDSRALRRRLEAEDAPRDREQHGRDAEPQQAVLEQQAGDRRHASRCGPRRSSTS